MRSGLVAPVAAAASLPALPYRLTRDGEGHQHALYAADLEVDLPIKHRLRALRVVVAAWTSSPCAIWDLDRVRL